MDVRLTRMAIELMGNGYGSVIFRTPSSIEKDTLEEGVLLLYPYGQGCIFTWR